MSKITFNYNNPLPKNLFLFIWNFLHPYKYIALLFITFAICAGFRGPFNNMLMKYIINLLLEIRDGDMSVLMLPAILIVLNFILFDNVTWRGIGYISYKYKGVIRNTILKKMLDHIFMQSHQFFQDDLSGRIFNQIIILTENIELILFRISLDFLRGSSLLLISFATSFYVNPIFFYILLVWFIGFAIFSVWMSKKIRFLANKYAQAETLLSGQLVDSITNQTNVRIFARKAFELVRMDYYFDVLLKAFRQKEGFVLILYTIQGSMIAVMMAITVYFLVYLYSLGRISIGDFTLIVGISMELGHAMWYAMNRVDEFNHAYGKCKQSLSALMVTFEIKDIPDAQELQVTEGQIVFDNVTFNYKGSGLFFKNTSIVINAGEKVGLVGYSGSGKSTFVNLILRLYDVTGGQILIDNQNIKNVTQESLHTAITLIPQEPTLFHRSLMENIAYGQVQATDEEIITAAKKAHAHEFITQFAHQYDTLVGERGAKLSGGQRQRIAISRAFLKNAPILILDEATSQLDSITESLIQESLWELMQNKTTIVIAHRLSTLLSMDRILVFDQGKIVGDGTHEELYRNGGLYKKLWDAQVGEFLGDKNMSHE